MYNVYLYMRLCRQVYAFFADTNCAYILVCMERFFWFGLVN